MSGPKCFNLAENALRNARRANRGQCDAILAEYRRLFQRTSQMVDRARKLAMPGPSLPAEPASLADRAERAFANVGVDGSDVVQELVRERNAMAGHLSKLTAAVRDQVADLQRRVRGLGKQVGRLQLTREQFESDLAADLPPELPKSEVFRIRASAVAALKRIEIPSLLESAETPEEIARLSDTEAAAAATERALELAEREFQQDVRDTYARLVTAKLSSSLPPAETLRDYLAKHSPSASGEVASDTYAEKADRLLAELCLLQSHASWSSLRSRALAIDSEGDPELRRTAYEALVVDCGTLLKQLRLHEAWRTRIEALMDRTATATSLSATRLRGQLQDHLRAGDMADISGLERELVSEAEAEAQRRIAEARRQAVLDSLAAIGYEISGAPMETGLVQAGKLVIHKPGNAEYAVEVVMNADTSLVQTAMVRHSDTAEMTEQQRLRDCEQEEQWCGDHARLREEMARRGFDSAFKLQLPAGQHPVRVVVRPEAERPRPPMASMPVTEASKGRPPA